MKKYTLLFILITGVLFTMGHVSAEQNDGNQAAMDWFSEISEKAMELDQSGSGPVFEEIDSEDSGELPFEDYNSPPDLSGGQRVEGQGKPPSHFICPGSVGNLTLDLSNRQGEIRITNNFHHVGCSYVETRYVAGHYQTYKLASFSVAWAEDNSVSEGIKNQLCRPSYIGWEEWSDNGKAASITDVYLHDDLIGLKNQLKMKIKEGLAKAEARAIGCGGGAARGGAQSLTADAVWERAKEKCNRPTNTKPDFTITEYLTYLRKVEEANPDANWKQILTALHADEFAVDLNRELPLINKVGIHVPLFQFGEETRGWENVDLVCKNPPKFVYDDRGRKIDIDHAYAGPRSDLNRRGGVSSKIITWIAGRDIWSDFMRAANTILGDYWQVYFEGPSKFPMDQARGDLMGDWLGRYYENPDNAGKSLSQAFEDYFQ